MSFTCSTSYCYRINFSNFGTLDQAKIRSPLQTPFDDLDNARPMNLLVHVLVKQYMQFFVTGLIEIATCISRYFTIVSGAEQGVAKLTWLPVESNPCRSGSEHADRVSPHHNPA